MNINSAHQEPKRDKANILARIASGASLPSLVAAVEKVRLISKSDRHHVSKLADMIRADAPLTQKIIRVSNSMHYSRGDRIDDLFRAISLIGLTKVGSIAEASIMLSQFDNANKSRDMQRVLAKCSLMGLICYDFCPPGFDPEAASICGLLHSLGEVFVATEYPDIWKSIKQRTRAIDFDTKESISSEVLGIPYFDITIEILKQTNSAWLIENNLRSPQNASDSHSNLTDLMHFADELADQLLDCGLSLDDFDTSFLNSQKGTLRDIEPSVAFKKIKQSVTEFEILVGKKTAREFAVVSNPAESRSSELSSELTALPEKTIDNTRIAANDEGVMNNYLSLGFQKLKQANQESGQITPAIATFLKIIKFALKLNNCIFFETKGAGIFKTADFQSDSANSGIADIYFSSTLTQDRNVFSVCSNKAIDVFINNSLELKKKDLLPTWFDTYFEPCSFFILCLNDSRGVVKGIIYADKQRIDSLQLKPSTINLLKKLRNQLSGFYQ